MALPKDFLPFSWCFFTSFPDRARSKTFTQIKIFTFSTADEADGHLRLRSLPFFLHPSFVVSRPSMDLSFLRLSPFRISGFFEPRLNDLFFLEFCFGHLIEKERKFYLLRIIWIWRNDDRCISNREINQSFRYLLFSMSFVCSIFSWMKWNEKLIELRLVVVNKTRIFKASKTESWRQA